MLCSLTNINQIGGIIYIRKKKVKILRYLKKRSKFFKYIYRNCAGSAIGGLYKNMRCFRFVNTYILFVNAFVMKSDSGACRYCIYNSSDGQYIIKKSRFKIFHLVR